MFLIILLANNISACQSQSNSNSNSIVGVWIGESQWLCGHSDPASPTTMEFKSDGSITAITIIQTELQTTGNGTWSLSENNIEIRFPKATTWTGTVSDSKMEGIIKNEDATCKGSWSLTKK